MPVAKLPAIFDPDSADPARLDAWLNLSQREKAREFVMVRASAMANPFSLALFHSLLFQEKGGRE